MQNVITRVVSPSSALIVLVLWVTMLGCRADDRDTKVLVFAAASLTDVFAEIEEAFEAQHAGIDVQLNLAGSAALREQILEGAPADVFASASPAIMQQIIDANEAEVAVMFATNSLVIAVPLENPGRVDGLDAFADPELLIGLCSPGVPCGDFARDALDQAGIEPSIDTNEKDVRSLLTKLAAAELDAGIVYATDALADGDVEALRLPDSVVVDIRYPIAVLSAAPNEPGAADFVRFVTSEVGLGILQSYGFGAP